MANKIEKWMKEIKKRQDGIASERDKLDEAISEMQGLREYCADAWHFLEDARDALSKLI